MIQIILAILFALCLMANAFMPFMGIILLTTGPLDLFAVTTAFALGFFAVLLFKYGVVTSHSKVFSGISAGAGYKRVWFRIVEGLKKGEGMLGIRLSSEVLIASIALVQLLDP